MNRTKIEWVKNPDGSQGYTWNPITGCLNHTNGLCKGGGFPCYAYKLANGRLKQRYLANENTIVSQIIDDTPINMMQKQVKAELDPFYPRFWEEKLYHPWNGKARGVFVCDMSDLFGIGIPEEWTRTILDLCRKHEQNRYYLLTKQPQRLPQFSPFPENCWVGVTATNEKMFHSGIESLKSIEATVRFISVEPLLSWNTPFDYLIWESLWRAHINWLIIGQQTPVSAKTEPKIEWIREIVEAADKAEVKVFLKNNLKPLISQNLGHTFPGFAYGERLRQEMP
jgi:protein gp37